MNERWKHLGRRVLRTGGGIFLGFLAAVLLFNLVIMPRFVRHGNEIEVPDLVGRPIAEAGARLAQAGLAVRDTLERPSATVRASYVLDQEPSGGSRIKPGRSVLLVVSRGMGERTVPDVAGQSKRYASLSLSQEGYELGDVVRVPSSTVPRDIVVASDPGAGETLSPGARVSLLVSNGPEREVWVMPELAGQDPELVADKLRFAGFPVVVEGADQQFRYVPLRIRGTYPPPGHTVAEGDTIRIYCRR